MNHPYFKSLNIRYPELPPIDCEELSTGLNVIYGPNEAGKSRIKDFIEWAMFSYTLEHESVKPAQRKAAFSHLIPGISGNWSVCINGEEIKVQQNRENDTTQVHSSNNNFSLLSISDALTDGMSREHYKNIFSLSLDELSFGRSNELMTEDELAETFLNASQTGSGVSLSSYVSTLRNNRDELFSTSSNTRNKSINKLLRKIQEIDKEINRLKRAENAFPDLENKIEVLTDKKNSFGSEIEKLEDILKNKRQILENYPQYISYKTLISSEPIKRNPDLAQKYAEIGVLLAEVKSALSKEHEKELLTAQIDSLNTEHEQQHILLSATLNPDELDTYAHTPDFLSNVKRYEQKLHSCEHSIKDIQTKIQENTRELSFVTQNSESLQSDINDIETQVPIQQIEISDQLNNTKKTSRLKQTVLATSALAASALFGIGFATSNMLMIIPGILIAALCIAPLIFSKKENVNDTLPVFNTDLEIAPIKKQLNANQARIEHFESIISELIEQEKNIETELETATKEYVDKLAKAGFKEYYDPNLIDIYLGAYSKYKDRQTRISDLENEYDRDNAEIQGLLNRTNSLKELAVDTDAEIAITLATLATSTTWLSTLLETSKTFISAENQSIKREQSITEYEKIFTQNFGSIDNTEIIFSSSTQEQLTEDIAQVLSKKNNIEQERDLINQEIGSLKHQIETASTSTELVDAARTREELIEELSFEHKQYAINFYSAQLAEEAFIYCQRENQPTVLRTASWMLKQATLGAWDSVSVVYTEQLRKEPKPEIQVSNTTNATSLMATKLSRGTQEQLYLALRFALMQTSIKGQHVPVLFDDIGVNFDLKRFKAISSLFKDISYDRQVFYFTCHESTRDALAELSDTKIIEI